MGGFRANNPQVPAGQGRPRVRRGIWAASGPTIQVLAPFPQVASGGCGPGLAIRHLAQARAGRGRTASGRRTACLPPPLMASTGLERCDPAACDQVAGQLASRSAPQCSRPPPVGPAARRPGGSRDCCSARESRERAAGPEAAPPLRPLAGGRRTERNRLYFCTAPWHLAGRAGHSGGRVRAEN